MLYFISDLHLNPDYPERTARFRRFVDDVVARSRSDPKIAVYILGDLFDFWYEMRRAILTHYDVELGQLKRLASVCQSIGIIYGNRDFSYRNWLPDLTAGTIAILGDSAEIELGNKTILLTHGDTLCTGDAGYQKFRRRIRSRPVRWLFRLIPWAVAKRIVGGLKKGSQRHKSSVDRNAMTLDKNALRQTFRDGYDIIISGHVHELKVRPEVIDDQQKIVITLGNWLKRIEYVTYDESGFSIHEIDDDT